MCGIAGFYSRDNFPENPDKILKLMGSAIEKRGPDSSGEWFDNEQKIGFSHRRLAILELSDAGNQPMYSHTKNFVIIFNGEIYNHLEIRKEIESISKVKWNGLSDTETLLMAIEVWGLEETLKKASGMYAFALWNKIEKKLYLARDPFGEKPLYYGFNNEVFLFGSELKSLRQYPNFEAQLDKKAVNDFLKYSYIPAPKSIYENISKLQPGKYLTFNTIENKIDIHSHWCIDHEIQKDFKLEQKKINFPDEMEGLIINSIREQLISDVPLGAFLSGGVDSSLIVSLMQKISSKPVKTFSIGFKRESLDEAIYAKKIANHLKTDHRELYVSDEDALNVVKILSDIYDEPFADSSQIPTYLVSKMARDDVTVCISGDAGDEIFGGYNRHLFIKRYWKKISITPLILRKFIGFILLKIPERFLESIYSYLPRKLKIPNLKEKLVKFSIAITSKDFNELYERLISVWQNPNECLKSDFQFEICHTKAEYLESNEEDFQNAMLRDIKGYLNGDILVKVDRAAMHNSLETRIPFLNKKIFKAAYFLPSNEKINNGTTKKILREILFKYVPKELIERPKSGFAVPLDDWLRGPLKKWGENLLRKDLLEEQGIFDAEKILSMWSDHQNFKHNYKNELWNILVLQNWLINNNK